MDDAQRTDERAVIEECVAGKSDRYAVLVERYKTMAYTLAYRMLGDADAADDMAQESFLSAFLALKEFQFRSKFSSWLASIVINKCRDALRARRDTVPVDDVAGILRGRERSPEDQAAARETGDIVQRGLDQLPESYREIIILKHIEGLDYQEIADIIGGSITGLKVRAHRARELLKEYLKERVVL
jgi:RNA polymerase sigma-70 factor (ECF subfamily)